MLSIKPTTNFFSTKYVIHRGYILDIYIFELGFFKQKSPYSQDQTRIVCLVQKRIFFFILLSLLDGDSFKWVLCPIKIA